MTAIPSTKPILPFTPTEDEHGNPSICRCCGRRAIGIGIGLGRPKDDPGYLCGECVLLIEELRKVRRLDVYEMKALDAGVEAVGEYIATHGITDLSFFDELMQRMLVKAAWVGCADGLRKLVKEGSAPF